MMSSPIYITGYGIISAIGNNKEDVLASLLSCRSGISEMQYLQSKHKEFPVGEVKLSDEQMREWLALPFQKPANRTSLMGTIALKEAVEDAGLSDCLKNVTFISGNTVGGMDYTEQCFLDIQDCDDQLSVLATHDCGSTTLLQAEYFGIPENNTVTISTACSSAANAMIVGANLIKAGKAGIVIAGGSEAITKFHLNGFNTLMILDDRQCRPFDALRKGLNLGEGAAYIVLESAESVKSRGRKPIAELRGYGNACDAYHQTASSPNGEGAYLAMKKAMDMSGLKTSDIKYINAHGTGTPNNDICESAALKRLFGDGVPPISSTKSFTGHTTSASGAIETVICLLALQYHFLPSNLGWENPMENGIRPTLGENGCDLDYVMCNSFGFGGNDSSLILSKYSGILTSSLPVTLRPVYVRARHTRVPKDDLSSLRDFVSPSDSRRMCNLLKSALVSSMTALHDAGIKKPDGIFMGTKFGMLANSEKFLNQMCHDGEYALSPTLFMQSTHNTIAGMLAILTKCHGYNITFTQGKRSLECALRDAALLISSGQIDNALVGCHDESTPVFSDLFRRLTGDIVEIGEYSTSIVLSCEPGDTMIEFKEF